MRGWVVLCCVLWACTPEPEGPTLILGAGDGELEPLSDGDDAVIIQGPQGGFHLLGSLHATGIEPGDTNDLENVNNPTVHFTVREEGERVDVSTAFTQGLDEVDRGVYGVIGRFIFLDIQADDELVGSTLTVRVELTDVNGVAMADEVQLIGVASPFNE